MSTCVHLVATIEAAGGCCFVDSGRLIVDAPAELLSDGVVSDLKRLKTEIIGLLELKELIATVGSYHGASNQEIQEFFNDTLQHHPIDVALTTFRNLAAQIPFCFPVRKKATNDIYTKAEVTCAKCQHFQSNVINKAGMGSCKLGAWKVGQPPLYPYSNRKCDEFKRIADNDQ